MAGGNFTAMMVCGTNGISNNTFYYAMCYSTDSQLFISSVSLSRKFLYYSSYAMKYSLSSSTEINVENAISLADILSSKWVLFESTITNAMVASGGLYSIVHEHTFSTKYPNKKCSLTL